MRILSLAPLAGRGLADLQGLGELVVDPWIEHVPIKLHSADELRVRLADVDVLIVEADHIPADVLDAVSLRAIGVCRGDPVNVDIDAATRNGIAVVRTPGRNADGVAELTIGLIIAVIRGIVAADDDIRAARWVVDGKIAQQRYRGRELSTSTVGLVGFGAVGRATASRLRALGATVLAHDPLVEAAEMTAADVIAVHGLGELMERSDVVSVHAALNEATRGMIDAAAFARLRRGSFFVNTARFGIADEAALLEALGDGRLAAAAFDHFTGEFLPEQHPLVSMPNVILTPHIGGATDGAVERHTTQVAEGLRAALAGSPHPFMVNPEAIRTGAG